MQVLSSLSSIPFYAPSAGHAPTNSADVSAIASAYAESAASSKLDSTASSSFYPSDNPSGFISGVDLSDYATTAYVDSSVSGKLDTTAQVVTSIGVAAGALSSINGYGLSAGLANSAGTATVWLGASSKLDASAASDFALTAQLEDYLEKTASSQFLTAVPDGYATEQYVDSSISGFAYESAVSGWTAKQDALTYGYNAANQISSIDGSALGGMDEAAVSGIASAYAESAVSSVSGNYYTTANESGYALSSDVSATVDLVGTQSANWGGSALQLSAGLGVSLVKSGNILIASTDETLLWERATGTSGSYSGTFSEDCSNFDRLRFHFLTNDRAQFSQEMIPSIGYQMDVSVIHPTEASVVYFKTETVSASGTTFGTTNIREGVSNSITANWTQVGTGTMKIYVTRVVGINRTAEA